MDDLRLQAKKNAAGVGTGGGFAGAAIQQTPWATMASATLVKPAMFAPTM